MALNTSKCNHLTPLPFKGLNGLMMNNVINPATTDSRAKLPAAVMQLFGWFCAERSVSDSHTSRSVPWLSLQSVHIPSARSTLRHNQSDHSPATAAHVTVPTVPVNRYRTCAQSQLLSIVLRQICLFFNIFYSIQSINHFIHRT